MKGRGCAWDQWTFAAAARGGNLKNVKWPKEQGCSWNDWTFNAAVQNGNDDILEWLKEQGCPWGNGLRIAAMAYKIDLGIQKAFDYSYHRQKFVSLALFRELMGRA